ncbi:MAG: hypothetical protein HUJ58_08410 [Erysipelotrichaceae bacterium]|nr:hypothetical protein [Erysipelotrichaceae bacterium]
MTKRKSRRVGPGQIAFMIINTVLVLAILGTYGYRLIHYKKVLEEKRNNQVTQNSLSTIMIDKIDLMDKSGLVDNGDGTYTFNAGSVNNYITYSGRMFRAMGIDEFGSITMVSEETVTGFTLYGEDFPSSRLYEWLHTTEDKEHSGVFQDTLESPYAVLMEQNYCADKIDDLSSICCDYPSEQNMLFRLLTLEDYKKYGGAKGYLNSGDCFWLASQNGTNDFWYVDDEGNISGTSNHIQTFGVKVVLKLQYQAKAEYGSGTAKDPYALTDMNGMETIADIYSGQYVQYGGSQWIVESMKDGNAILLLDGVLTNEDGTPYTRKYGSSSTYTTKEGIGKYLNNTYLEKLPEYESYLVKNTWNLGSFSTLGEYEYTNAFEKTVKAYVGLPNISNLYLDQYMNIFTSMYNKETDKLVYVLTEKGTWYATTLDVKYQIRPMICMKGDVVIVSGSGTATDPYVVEPGGETNESE